MLFESFVNSERYKTEEEQEVKFKGLRALLIQKDTKHPLPAFTPRLGLRALLIQKDTKLLIIPIS